jgi:hypothetical protein
MEGPRVEDLKNLTPPGTPKSPRFSVREKLYQYALNYLKNNPEPKNAQHIEASHNHWSAALNAACGSAPTVTPWTGTRRLLQMPLTI